METRTALERLIEAEATDLWIALADTPNPKLRFRMPAVMHVAESAREALLALYDGADEVQRLVITSTLTDLYGLA